MENGRRKRGPIRINLRKGGGKKAEKEDKQGSFWHDSQIRKNSKGALLNMTVAHIPSPVEMEGLDELLKTIFNRTANELAFETRFVRRVRKITGATYAQALVFGWLAHPDASFTQLQEMLALLGCDMSAQALEKRLAQAESADFLQSLLSAMLGQCVSSEAVDTELFKQFEGVYLQDGTIISLPNELKGLYKGFGGNTEESGLSALRVQVRVNLVNGAMQGPWLQEAVACEREGAGSLEQLPLPVNALHVVDSHYPSMKIMKKMTEAGQWFLTHIKADIVVYDERGVKYTIPEFLKKYEQEQMIDVQVGIGNQGETRQHVRLLAFRVSPERAKQRREQVNRNTKKRSKGSRRDVRVGKKHQRPSKDGSHRHRPGKTRIELAEWTILLTNVSAQRLSPQQARALMRARWQIELLWKLWKQRGMVDIWRSEKPMRILSEIYAKLIGMVVQHWVTLVGCWQAPDRSMVKASMVVGLVAVSYALSLTGSLSSVQVLEASKRAMKRCRLDQSHHHLSTARMLEEPALSCRLS